MSTEKYGPEYVEAARAALTGAPCFFCGAPKTRIALDPQAEGLDTPLCAAQACYIANVQSEPTLTVLSGEQMTEMMRAGILTVSFGRASR
jgi:hypothetical protein